MLWQAVCRAHSEENDSKRNVLNLVRLGRGIRRIVPPRALSRRPSLKNRSSTEVKEPEDEFSFPQPQRTVCFFAMRVYVINTGSGGSWGLWITLVCVCVCVPWCVCVCVFITAVSITKLFAFDYYTSHTLYTEVS
jgi:hypothetical protein